MELSFSNLFVGYLDYLTGNFALGIYLLAVTDERAVLRRLKKFLPLFLFPIIEILLVIGMYSVPELRRFQYYILSFIILLMCTFWARWAWQFGFWQALAATCMAGIFQVCESTLSRVLIWENTLDESTPFAVVMLLYLGISTAAVPRSGAGSGCLSRPPSCCCTGCGLEGGFVCCWTANPKSGVQPSFCSRWKWLWRCFSEWYSALSPNFWGSTTWWWR